MLTNTFYNIILKLKYSIHVKRILPNKRGTGHFNKFIGFVK